MSANVPRLLQNYPEKEFIRATTQREVFDLLVALKDWTAKQPNLSEFPEGACGVVICALLDLASVSCPDVGDFSHIYHGMQKILKASYDEISREIKWFR